MLLHVSLHDVSSENLVHDDAIVTKNIDHFVPTNVRIHSW